MDVANGAFGQDVRYAPCASVYYSAAPEYLDKLINVSPARETNDISPASHGKETANAISKQNFPIVLIKNQQKCLPVFVYCARISFGDEQVSMRERQTQKCPYVEDWTFIGGVYLWLNYQNILWSDQKHCLRYC